MNPVTNPEGFAAGMGIMITVITIASVVIPIGLVLLFLIPFYKRRQKTAQLQATGHSVMATIQQVGMTGTSVNGVPEVELALLIQPQGGAPFQAVTTDLFSQFEITRIQPGMQVPVRVDPSDPSSVAIDKAGLMMMPMGGMGVQMMGGYQAQAVMQQAAMQQAAMQHAAWGGAAAPQQAVTCPHCRQTFSSSYPACPACGAPRQGW